MVSGLGLQFSYEKYCFKTIDFYRENLPVKSNYFKTIVFYREFRRALRAL